MVQGIFLFSGTEVVQVGVDIVIEGYNKYMLQ